MHLQVIRATSHVHRVEEAVDELCVSAHLHALVKVVVSWADPLSGSHHVLAVDPVLAGSGIGHETVSENVLAKSRNVCVDTAGQADKGH